jgi:vancomycin permeability regulator SanA
MKRTLKWIAFPVALIAALFVASCAVVSHTRNAAFEQVEMGATEAQVVAIFGTAPTVREKPNKVFSRYASSACAPPCAERVWYENPFSLDIEAWSFELDHNGRVVHKAHWVSP